MEDPALFEATTKYTKESYTEFQRFNLLRGSTLGKFMIVFLAFCIIWGIIIIASYFIENDNIFQLISGVLFIITGIVFLFSPQSSTYWLYIRNRALFDVGMEYRFYDDHFTGTAVGSAVKGDNEVKYNGLQKIWERKDCFYIIVNSVQSFMLGKDSFTLGTPEEFTAMMTKILPPKKFISYTN